MSAIKRLWIPKVEFFIGCEQIFVYTAMGNPFVKGNEYAIHY